MANDWMRRLTQEFDAIRGKQTPLGFVQLSGLNTAKALPSVPAGTRYAVVQCETQAVRWRDDGTDPTSAVGMSLAVGAELRYDGDLTKIKFIEKTASAALSISYYA